MKYTNGEETGLNKYETKVSQKVTMRSLEVWNGFRKVRGGTGHNSTPLL